MPHMTTNAMPTLSEPMQLGSTRLRRCQEGQSFYCGNADHLISQCLERRKSGSQQTNTRVQDDKKTSTVSISPFIPLPLCQIHAAIKYSDTSSVVPLLITSGSAGNFMDRRTADQLHIPATHSHNGTTKSH